MPGPTPKRSEERRRRNKDTTETIKINLDEVLAGEVEIPAPPERYYDEETGEERGGWHPVAEDLYLSLAKSGQALFYEPSDWMIAYAMAEALSRELSPKPIVQHNEDGSTNVVYAMGPVNGAVLGQVNKMLGDLMASEGQRRIRRIELDRKKAQEAKLAGDGKVVTLVQSREELFK